MKLQCKGLSVHYTVTGDTGSSVLLLHGWGANVKMYAGVIQHLAQSHVVYALDFPGFGDSEEPPEPWCVDDYTDLVSEFMTALDIQKVSLIGHSFGGRVIAKLIARGTFSERITQVILMDSAGIRPKKSLKAKWSIFTYKVAKVIFQTPVMRFLYPDYLEHMRKRRGSADYNAASPVMRGTLVRVVNEDLQKELACITQPTLLIWGAQDPTTPLSDGIRMKELIEDSDIVVVPGGHFSYVDSPGLVLGAMESFLE